MFKKRQNLQFFISIIAVVAATVIICLCAATCSKGNIKFEKTYYFVYYKKSDNAISADSLSQTADSYGGAGYVLSYKNNFYITYACYYSSDEADGVCSNLKRRDLDCDVLKVETDKFSLNHADKKLKELYLGDLNTFDSLSRLAYECANGLDTGKYSQSKAKDIVGNILSTLNGLLKTNENNSFYNTVRTAADEVKVRASGFIASKNMRYIQILLIDGIINAFSE